MDVACTQCGSTNPAGQRFCGQCAAPLPPSPGNVTLVPPGAPTAAPGTCWQCGAAVDPAGRTFCDRCGATIGGGLQVPPGGAEAGPFGAGPPPPPALGDGAAPAAGPRERAFSPMVATALIAIAIIVALAIVGVIAGQSIGR